MKQNFIFSIVLLSILLFSCSDNKDTTPIELSGPLFHEISSDITNINFENTIIENELFNNLNYDVLYNGGGVAVGDINNDGLMDLYFTGNQVRDALYLNKGNFIFEDISQSSGIASYDFWSSGVAMADVNNDGFLDIYVTKYLLSNEESRKNLLLINNGDNTFTNQAKEWGVDDKGFTTCANFLDYDKDGNIDLYVGNQFNSSAFYKRLEQTTKDYLYSDKLYRNTGQGTFEDVTKIAGVQNYGAALSVTCGDLNQDGWPDIYVANDYAEPDFIYYNQQNGTFKNLSNFTVKHMSTFSMGADIGDINNDGWPDVFVADMGLEDNFRSKTNMSGMNPEQFWELANNGYHFQYMFNALQLNNGGGVFSEIAQLSGVSKTDWSWSPLIADLDMDGWKDLFVTNGLMRDTKNNDHRIELKEAKDQEVADRTDEEISRDLLALSLKAPSVKIENISYRNNGKLGFDKIKEEWGLSKKGWSNGSALADLDNDGDMDIVVNNLNEKPSIYKNMSVESGKEYIGLDLSPYNESINATVELEFEDGSFVYDYVHPVRGYLSQSDARLRIGTGGKKIKSLNIQWLSGGSMRMEQPKTNKIYKLDMSNAKGSEINSKSIVTSAEKLDFPLGHVENVYDDFKREILLPYKLSSLGPCIAVADINGDGLEDIFVGGSSGFAGATFLQDENGGISPFENPIFAKNKTSEDVDACFFDFDQDGDQDLYVSSGSNEFPKDSPLYQDRLYKNDGKGIFSLASLPQNKVSSGRIAKGDADGDGDIDLFISGRQSPGEYGFNVSSSLLINNNGVFEDKTSTLMPELKDLGMITDASWADIDNDGDNDLIVVGEWSPIHVFRNDGSSFSHSEVLNSSGWWTTIESSDVDGDGDIDFLLGNLGLNIKYKASKEEPFKLYTKDFDGNGSHDVYLGYYENGVCYPVRGRQCSSQQMPFIKKKFENYETFAKATIDDVLEGMTDNSVIKEAKIFESVWLENDGQGNFSIHALPIEAQLSQISSFVKTDINNDGKPEYFASGNYYDREVETTRSDAGTGVFLKFESGGIETLTTSQTGISADKDARRSIIWQLGDKKVLIVANNNGQFDAWRY